MTSVEHNPYQGSFISGQTVTRDAQGRVVTLDEARVGHDTITHTYGYNTRGELIADNESVPADSPVTPQAYIYAYDAIGNRTQAWNSRDTINSAYTVNNLNQYTAITTTAEEEGQGAFTPAYDEEGKTADGCKAVWTNSESLPEGREAERRLRVNQTQIRTGTGNWQVTYNADNRPVTFTQGARRIENKYDQQGRRVEKALYQNGLLQKRLHFIYNGYLQIAALDTTDTTPILLHTLHWDPTEPVATRPLVLIRPEDNGQNWYEYTHTLNKNIANLTDKTGFIVAHYDYDAYGNTTEQTGPLATENPFRYSSEYHDEELGLIYYNYRHYNPKDGRWINRDPIAEKGGTNLYGFAGNNPIFYYDDRGLIIPLLILVAKVISVAVGAYSAYKIGKALVDNANTFDRNRERSKEKEKLLNEMIDNATHDTIPSEDIKIQNLDRESLFETKNNAVDIITSMPNTSFTGPYDYSFATNPLEIAEKLGKLHCSYRVINDAQKRNCFIKEISALTEQIDKIMKNKGYKKIKSSSSRTGYYYRRPNGRNDLSDPQDINSLLEKSTNGDCSQ